MHDENQEYGNNNNDDDFFLECLVLKKNYSNQRSVLCAGLTIVVWLIASNPVECSRYLIRLKTWAESYINTSWCVNYTVKPFFLNLVPLLTLLVERLRGQRSRWSERGNGHDM